MYEGVKGGLHAELIRNRSFEEPPNAIGLSRNWERYPDDRNDDYALTFQWDDQFPYPKQRSEVKEHSTRIEIACSHWVEQNSMNGYTWKHPVENSRVSKIL